MGSSLRAGRNRCATGVRTLYPSRLALKVNFGKEPVTRAHVQPLMFHPNGPTFFELARQCLSSTEKGYDLLAPKFDYTPFRTPEIVLSIVAHQLEKLAPFRSALDICCGTGAAMQCLRPLCTDRVVGLDMSRGMLEVAKQNLLDVKGNADLEFNLGNALDMPFDAEFDLAVCFGAFGHILPKDEPQLVQQIARALKPGGKFVFVTSAMPPLWSSTYWLCRGFNAAMHLRNWIVRPPFIMYYLTFLLPETKTLLENHGFDVDVEEPFEGILKRLRMVVATRHEK